MDSDSTFKQDFIDISNPIYNLRKIKGYKYKFKDDYLKSIPEKEKGKYKMYNYGFSAQEIENIIPELTQKDDSTGKYSVNYIGFIPILVEALNQQQNIIDAQSLKIKELNDRLAKIEIDSDEKSLSKSDMSTGINSESINGSSTKVAEKKDNIVDLVNNFLYQNVPNPFSKKTEIKYFIDEGVKTSMLMIFDMQGVLLKQISLNSFGLGTVIIEASEFKAGMYMYTLICNGQEIDTKRMILTE